MAEMEAEIQELRLRGKVIRSFPGRDVVDDREKSASPLLPSVYLLDRFGQPGRHPGRLPQVAPPHSFTTMR